MTYILQKKTKCMECVDGVAIFHDSQYPENKVSAACGYCTGGYVYEEADFLEVLKELGILRPANQTIRQMFIEGKEILDK